MKAIPRSGWISHGVSLQDIESVADHSFSASALALLIADLEARRGKSVNAERVLRLAVFHDLAESLTFDISKEYLEYVGRRGKAIKRELEYSAWKHILAGIEQPTLRRDYENLQKEFEAERTFEARIVRAADRLDVLLQVIAYRKKGYPAFLFADLWNKTLFDLRSSRIPSVGELQRILVGESKRADAKWVR